MLHAVRAISLLSFLNQLRLMLGMSKMQNGIWKWRQRREGKDRVEVLVMLNCLSSVRKDFLRTVFQG